MPYFRLLCICSSVLMFHCAWAQEASPGATLLGAGLWSRPAYDGSDAGQTIFHLHWHVLGGKISGMPE